MNLDEAIAHAREVAGHCPEPSCALDHKQLADWLSELKWQKSRNDYFQEYYQWRQRAERAERLLNETLTPKEVGRAHHIADLEQKNQRLKEEVRMMQEKAEVFNRLLYATGLIVNCTGCIPGAPANYKDLTEEKVQEVEQIARRLRTWWTNNQHRIEREDETREQLEK